jgi:hypothetical protein
MNSVLFWATTPLSLESIRSMLRYYDRNLSGEREKTQVLHQDSRAMGHDWVS